MGNKLKKSLNTNIDVHNNVFDKLQSVIVLTKTTISDHKWYAFKDYTL